MTNKHLNELKDIVDIDLISWWPLATGWWLIISGIVLVFGYLAYKAHKYVIFKKSWRYTIYNKLEELECSLNIQPTSEQISFISKYIRLLNIRIHSRADCAALTGQDWIKWFKRT